MTAGPATPSPGRAHPRAGPRAGPRDAPAGPRGLRPGERGGAAPGARGRAARAPRRTPPRWRSSARATSSMYYARTLAQIGLAEQALGRWVEAETHLHDALAQTPEDPLGRAQPGGVGALPGGCSRAPWDVAILGVPADLGAVRTDRRAPRRHPPAAATPAPGGGGRHRRSPCAGASPCPCARWPCTAG